MFCKFFVAATEKNLTWSFNFKLPNINAALLWLILKWYTILEDFFLLDSVRYRDDVTTLKAWLVQYRDPDARLTSQLTSSCVSFTIYQQCYGDIEDDVTLTSLQCQNVHWVNTPLHNFTKKCWALQEFVLTISNW